MWTSALVAAMAIAPTLVSAAVFPKGGLVKEIDAKGFTKVMKGNRTSVVAFVAPWCGHCQRMAPEYSKAAKGLDPLIPLYAIDCDAEKNKRLCGEQGVKGFPTIKLFPRGGRAPPQDFESGDRTSKNFYYWATKKVPNVVQSIKGSSASSVKSWLKVQAEGKNAALPRAVLLYKPTADEKEGKDGKAKTKEPKVPLLWTVLANALRTLSFAAIPDPDGSIAAELGAIVGPHPLSRVVLFAPGAGQTRPVLYEGPLKWEPLSKYLLSVGKGDTPLVMSDASEVKVETKGEKDKGTSENAVNAEEVITGEKEATGTSEAAEPEAEERKKDEL